MTRSIDSIAGNHAGELTCAAELAVAAGKVVLRYHGTKLEVSLKPGDEPVTAADRDSSALIVKGLEARFPDDVVISEESSDDMRRRTASRVWYVDPIDGTKDFIRGEDGFCVMIGLVIDGAPALGLVHQPLHDLTYLAAPGQGAFRRVGAAALERIQCSDTAHLPDLRMVISRSHRDAIIDEIKAILGSEHEENVGSVGLKLGLLAAGRADLYVTTSDKCSSWDTAGPAAILGEAGGRLTDIDGLPLRYDQESVDHPRGLLASNGRVHDAVVAALAPLFAR